MSIVKWLIVAVIAYFVNDAYQRIQYARKKAEFIRDRRRAAGIPDDDNRPFAVARADALSRRSQQKREEHVSTPVKKRTLTPSRSQTSIDPEAAARLSGIPGTLPGYLKDNFANGSSSSVSQRRPYEAPQTKISNSPRSPSPVKHRNATEKNSSQKTARRQDFHTQAQQSPTLRRSPAKVDDEGSPSAHRNLKRRQQASPTKSEVEPTQNKAQRVTLPGAFGEDQAIADADMSDATQSETEDVSEAMDEDENDDDEAEGSQSQPAASSKNKARAAREGQLQSLQTAARATAKKREADELEGSDTEQSVESIEDEAHAQAQPHGSKRSRTANKELDPRSSLDFDIALPEEAMTDFIPVHDASSAQARSKGSGVQTKRQADTSDDRQPGEEWTDYEGLRWRIHPETHELQRWSDVLEWRSKYRMPRDSLHPMAKESHQVVVHKWLTKQEWEDAKAKKLLSFQEPERLADKEKLEREEAEKMRRKQELLAKIRQTSSPNKRIQSYLAQQQRRQLQHKLSRGELSGDVSMNSYVTNETDGDGDGASMSLDSSSIVGVEGGTPGKPRSRRISLQSRMTPARADGSGGVGREVVSTSGASSPSDSPNRRRGSPLASPYRPIAYPKSKRGNPATSSPLVTSTFPSPPPSSTS